MGLPVRGLHGAHLRADLVARFGRQRIANAVAHRELCPLWRGVLVEPDRLLDPWTRAAAATLSAGPMSAITGATAAVLHGCPAADSPGHPRGTVRAAVLLDLASERVDSPAESWIRLMIVENGFPVPEVNWPVTDAAGREVYRLDLAWPRLRIMLEYDGVAAHAGQEEHDRARRADLERRGWIVVVVTKDDLRSFSRVLAALKAAFAARGYTW